MTLRKTIGSNIRAYRLERGLTQEALAFKARLHENYVSLVERGSVNISVDSIEKIVKVLKIPSYLLFLPNSIALTINIAPKE